MSPHPFAVAAFFVFLLKLALFPLLKLTTMIRFEMAFLCSRLASLRLKTHDFLSRSRNGPNQSYYFCTTTIIHARRIDQVAQAARGFTSALEGRDRNYQPTTSCTGQNQDTVRIK
jgi:hypothetical protein